MRREQGYYWVDWCGRAEIAFWQNLPFPAWWFADEGNNVIAVDNDADDLRVLSERLEPPTI